MDENEWLTFRPQSQTGEYDMRQIKLGIIGCGPIAQAAHLPATRKSKFVDLVALCDQADDLVQTIASQYQVPQIYTSHDDFLKKADIEAVVLAVSDSFHVPLALDCLRAGKHVLIEKPVATSSKEASALLHPIEKTSLKVLVGNMKRHDPGVEFAKRFVRDKLATLLSVNGWYCDSALRQRWQEALLLPTLKSEQAKQPETDPKGDKESYFLVTHGVHLVNTLQFLGGPIRRVMGTMTQRFGSYSWHALVEYQCGARGHLELTVRIRADWSEGFEIHGEFGSVRGKVFLPFLRRPSQVSAFDIRTGVRETPVDVDGDPYRRQLDSFARSIVADIPPVCTVEDGIRDLRTLEALKRSITSSSWEGVG